MGGKENSMFEIGLQSYQMSTPFLKSKILCNSVYFTAADGQQLKLLSEMFASCMNSMNSALHFMFWRGEYFPAALMWLFQRNMLLSLNKMQQLVKIR